MTGDDWAERDDAPVESRAVRWWERYEKFRMAIFAMVLFALVDHRGRGVRREWFLTNADRQLCVRRRYIRGSDGRSMEGRVDHVRCARCANRSVRERLLLNRPDHVNKRDRGLCTFREFPRGVFPKQLVRSEQFLASLHSCALRGRKRQASQRPIRRMRRRQPTSKLLRSHADRQLWRGAAVHGDSSDRVSRRHRP